MKKAMKIGLLAAAFGVSAPAFAADSELPGTFTGNVAIATDYMFRGISQSFNNAVVQGGLDWDTGAGFHFGTWGSAVNFGDGNAATMELDLYGGYGGTIDNFSYDVGGIYYWYPGSPKALGYNLWEVYGKMGYNFGVATAGISVNYTPDNFGNLGDALYYATTLAIPLGDMFAISAGAGYLDQSRGAKSLTDWNVGGTFKIPGWFDTDVRYYDSDIKVAGRFADDRIVVKFSRAF